MKVETYLVRCECARVYLFACTRVRHVRYSNEYACPVFELNLAEIVAKWLPLPPVTMLCI